MARLRRAAVTCGGDYLCGFTHGFPAATHQAGTGHAHFTAAPADKVGWYMTVLNDCN